MSRITFRHWETCVERKQRSIIPAEKRGYRHSDLASHLGKSGSLSCYDDRLTMCYAEHNGIATQHPLEPFKRKGDQRLATL
jgi:hypothetical protein